MNINNPKNDTRKSSLANMETWINESVVKAWEKGKGLVTKEQVEKAKEKLKTVADKK
jgi:hypothetical protein